MGAAKNSKTKGRWFGIPRYVVNSESWAKLKAPEVKLLVDVYLQYNGYNNGNLSACHTLMKKRGWAKSSLYRSFKKLIYSGFLVVTRQGMKVRGMPTLVAITWYGIDEPNKGHYDFGINPHTVPLSYWSKPKSEWKHQPNRKEI